MRIALLTSILLLAACENVLDEGEVAGAGAVDGEQAFTRQCAPTDTLKGIDVSYYQGNIDWNLVRQDGVKFAFMRVSDGLNNIDSKFDRNWTLARQNGVVRGAYQFFRSNLDPIAQADLLIAKVGALQPGDLPPMIDVESTDGRTPAQIAARVRQWMERVESVLGVKPIIYTGPYFWRDSVNNADMGDHPLWIAHYGTSCPFVPASWTRWTFHQHSASGSVRGIVGNVDMDLFAGTAAGLAALTVQGSGAVAPTPDGCTAMDRNGGTIDDGDTCFKAGGDPQWLTPHTGSGIGDDAITTGTTMSSQVSNYAEWTLRFQEAGSYELEVFIDPELGSSTLARYRITHEDGSTDAVVDQSLASGWISLGGYSFRTGDGQQVRLNDNTGERSTLGRELVFDAMRVTRLDDAPPPLDPCPRLAVDTGGSSLNVRPQPNTSLAAIGTLDDGSIVDRLATVSGQAVQGNSTWYRITDGAITGYVTAMYVTCTE